jgi:chromosome segregation ATPase
MCLARVEQFPYGGIHIMVQSEPAFPSVDPYQGDPQARVDQFSRMIEEMKVQLQAERDVGIPSEAQLRAELDTAQAEYNRLKEESDKAKAQAKHRKTEVDEWKQWYYSQPGLDKTAELEKLNSEIAWRATEIDTLQNQIIPLEASLVTVADTIEILKNKLAAVEAGVYLLPIEQDPRLLSLQEEYEAALAALNAGA